MDAELIFAEEVEVCPKCGSTEFWENRIICVGDDPTDEVLASIECKVCGAVFYARDYYRRRFGKPEDDEEIPFRKGVRSGLLVRITNWASYWLFSVCSFNGVACANLRFY